MNSYRKRALRESIRAFESITGTTLQKLLKGSIISCEDHAEDINSLGFAMDVYSGIDYITINDHGIRGLAVRCQFGDAYNTFTIRYKRDTGTKTEYEKRRYQIDNNYVYPEFTIQCYFDSPTHLNLISMAVVRTKDLYQALEDESLVETKFSNNEFKAIHFLSIPSDKIRTWQRKNKINIDKIKR